MAVGSFIHSFIRSHEQHMMHPELSAVSKIDHTLHVLCAEVQTIHQFIVSVYSFHRPAVVVGGVKRDTDENL